MTTPEWQSRESWRDHRNVVVERSVPTGETTCRKCGQEWPCEVAQTVMETQRWVAENIAELIRESAETVEEAARIADEQAIAYGGSP